MNTVINFLNTFSDSQILLYIYTPQNNLGDFHLATNFLAALLIYSPKASLLETSVDKIWFSLQLHVYHQPFESGPHWF